MKKQILSEEFRRMQKLAGILTEDKEKRTFDPTYKFTYDVDNNLDKVKETIIQDANQHIKYIADYFGTDKADELYKLITLVKNAKDADEVGKLLDQISDWFYSNTNIYTEFGKSKLDIDRDNS
jgi:hypothetical protein